MPDSKGLRDAALISKRHFQAWIAQLAAMISVLRDHAGLWQLPALQHDEGGGSHVRDVGVHFDTDSVYQEK